MLSHSDTIIVASIAETQSTNLSILYTAEERVSTDWISNEHWMIPVSEYSNSLQSNSTGLLSETEHYVSLSPRKITHIALIDTERLEINLLEFIVYGICEFYPYKIHLK